MVKTTKRKTNKKPTPKEEIKKPVLTFTYAEVLRHYISKPRALFKLKYQNNKHQTTIKTSGVLSGIALLLSPFSYTFTMLPLILLLVYLIFMYKQNDTLQSEYETEETRLGGRIYE